MRSRAQHHALVPHHVVFNVEVRFRLHRRSLGA